MNWYSDPQAAQSLTPSPAERSSANVSALELLVELEQTDRLPKDETEQAILAGYTGWLGIGWNRPALAPYLRPGEDIISIDTTQVSTPLACQTLWDVVERLGFAGGKVFEPGIGTGRIQAACPPHLRERVAFTGVENDPLNARIGRKLFPDGNVIQSRLQDVLIAEPCDLVIGHVPTNRLDSVNDKIIGCELDLHNYCIGRGLHALKPGGLLVVLVGRQTLDHRLSQRRYLANLCEFVGALRLPPSLVCLDKQPVSPPDENQAQAHVLDKVSEAFDIIILRRQDGRRLFERCNWLIARERKPLTQVTSGLPNRWGGVASAQERRRNEYFDAHQEMIIGTEYPGDILHCPSEDIRRRLSIAIQQLPENISVSKKRRPKAASKNLTSGPAGAYFVDEKGRLLYQDTSRSVVPSLAKSETDEKFRLALKSRVSLAKSYVGLRDGYLRLLRAQRDHSQPETEVDRLRQELNDLYDAQVEHWGQLREPGASWSLMSDDLYYFTVLGLEEVKVTPGGETFEISKSPVLSRRTVEFRSETSGAETAEDALVLSIGWKGLIDLSYMSSLIGRSEAEISTELLSRQLAYLNPLTNRLETREDYLSGNVREKYERAGALVGEGDERFKANLSALEAVLPKDIPIEEIDCKLGAKWVAPTAIAEFMRRFFKVEAEVSYNRADQWKIEVKSGRAAIENTTVWGCGEIRAHEIVHRLLNQRSMAVQKEIKLVGYDHLVRLFDPVATAAIEEKGTEIQQLFTQFARSTPDIAQQIARDFNAKLNSHVPKSFTDGRHLRLPGFSNVYRRDEHQLQAVWRGLLEGGGLKVYETGSGKTLIQVMLAREARRLKQVSRPLIVAHNPTLGQFAETFRLAYPDAKLLIAEPDNFAPDKRENFLKRAAKCDWDAIIVSHADFTKISCSRSAVERYYDQLIEDLEECLEDARYESNTAFWEINRSLKGVRKQKVNALEAYKHKSKTTWEDLKIDLLLVDEIQEFKRVPFTTKMEQIKGVNTASSHRGLDLAIKALDVQERNGNGRGVFGLSATPLDNSVAEIWNLARLTAPKKLQEFGVETFDQFAASFCDKISNLELNEANDKFRRVTRLAKFKNGQSFASFVGSFVDAYMPNAFRRIDQPGKPQLSTGRPIPVILQLSESNRRVKEMMKKIWAAYETSAAVQRYSYIPWLLVQLGQAAALDPRLVVPHFPEDRVSKIREIARNVARIYRQSEAGKGVQLVLMDRYRPVKVAKLEELVAGKFRDISTLGIEVADLPDGADSQTLQSPMPPQRSDDTFNAHRAQRRACIEEGLPQDEVVVLEDTIKDLKSREAQALWEKLNAGAVRVVIATRDKGATGINIQRRLIALHEADPPRSLRPGKMRQGHGRIDRQGNLNKEIYIYQYGMEQTADAGTYNRIETKARLFDQLLCGYAPGTNFDDPCSETVQSLAEIKAMITGDQRVIDLVRLQDEVRNLELQRRAFFRQLGENRRRLSEAQSQLETQRSIIIPRRERLFEVAGQGLIQKLFDKVGAQKEPINVTWLDKKLTVHGKQLSELLDFVFARVVTPSRPVALQIDHVWVRISHHQLLDRNLFDYTLLDPERPGHSLYSAEVHGTGADILRSLEALPIRAGEFLDQAKADLAKFEQDAAKLNGTIQTDWPDEIDLATKKDQVLSLERALEKGEEAQETADDWLTRLEKQAQEQADQAEFWTQSESFQLLTQSGSIRI